ncbi:hypothetical protein OUQ91_000007, partial [Loigolactobacillus backii]|nr:hypothetical protein [Loigolactobacillus backii]
MTDNISKNDDLNLNALFIGDKAENADLFKSTLIKLVNEHMGWRKNYMPQDKPLISEDEKTSKSFTNGSTISVVGNRFSSITDD